MVKNDRKSLFVYITYIPRNLVVLIKKFTFAEINLLKRTKNEPRSYRKS